MIGNKDGTSGSPNIHYDAIPLPDDCKKPEAERSVNAQNLRRIYRNMKGSLVWLHMKKPFVWPFNTFLGDKDAE